jgi:hypothetical protein
MTNEELRKFVHEVADETKGNITIANFAIAVAMKVVAAEREALRKAITEKVREWDDRAEAYGMLLARDIVDARSNAEITGADRRSG